MQLIEVIDKQLNAEQKLRLAVLIIDSAVRDLEARKEEIQHELDNLETKPRD